MVEPRRIATQVCQVSWAFAHITLHMNKDTVH
jgi:hypothetical protein